MRCYNPPHDYRWNIDNLHADILRDYAKAVDLSIAYSPVFPSRRSIGEGPVTLNIRRQIRNAPTTDNERIYFVPGTDDQSLWKIPAATVEEWRARYLLQRNILRSLLAHNPYATFPHSTQIRLIATWFPEGLFISELERASTGIQYITEDGTIEVDIKTLSH